MRPLNIVFMGSAELSCASLSAVLADKGMSVAAVVTQPDRPKGRHLKLTPSPVKELAIAAGLPVLQPDRARNPIFIDELRRFAPELILVVAYGQLLPSAILDMPRFGCINVHTSLLPKYRGAAPIQWAILNGEPETGVTIMRIDQGLDTGDILTQERTVIEPEDTSATLHDKLARIGADLLVRTIPDFVGGRIRPQPQPDKGASYAPKIRKQDGDIDWAQPSSVIWNKVRGLNPWPAACAWFHDETGAHRMKILRAEVAEGQGEPGKVLTVGKETLIIACGRGALRVRELQLEGGRPMDARQFLAGHHLPEGYGFSGAGPSPSIQ